MKRKLDQVETKGKFTQVTLCGWVGKSFWATRAELFSSLSYRTHPRLNVFISTAGSRRPVSPLFLSPRLFITEPQV